MRDVVYKLYIWLVDHGCVCVCVYIEKELMLGSGYEAERYYDARDEMSCVAYEAMVATFFEGSKSAEERRSAHVHLAPFVRHYLRINLAYIVAKSGNIVELDNLPSITCFTSPKAQNRNMSKQTSNQTEEHASKEKSPTADQ